MVCIIHVIHVLQVHRSMYTYKSQEKVQPAYKTGRGSLIRSIQEVLVEQSVMSDACCCCCLFTFKNRSYLSIQHYCCTSICRYYSKHSHLCDVFCFCFRFLRGRHMLGICVVALARHRRGSVHACCACSTNQCPKVTPVYFQFWSSVHVCCFFLSQGLQCMKTK